MLDFVPTVADTAAATTFDCTEPSLLAVTVMAGELSTESVIEAVVLPSNLFTATAPPTDIPMVLSEAPRATDADTALATETTELCRSEVTVMPVAADSGAASLPELLIEASTSERRILREKVVEIETANDLPTPADTAIDEFVFSAFTVPISEAETWISPWELALDPAIDAAALLDPRLSATTGETEMPALSPNDSAVVTAALEILASRSMSLLAITLISRPEVSALSSTVATAALGVLSAGKAPNSASIVLYRMFCGSAPMELKTNAKPTVIVSPAPSTMVSMSRSLLKPAVLSASTVTSPLVPPADSVLFSTSATACELRALVAIRPENEVTDSPDCLPRKALPPSAVTSPTLLVVSWEVASLSTAIEPSVVVIVE